MILAVDYVKGLGASLGYRVCPLQYTGEGCVRFCPTDARSGQYEPLTVFDNDINQVRRRDCVWPRCAKPLR